MMLLSDGDSAPKTEQLLSAAHAAQSAFHILPASNFEASSERAHQDWGLYSPAPAVALAASIAMPETEGMLSASREDGSASRVKRKKRQRGAAVIEATLLLLPTLALSFVLFDISFAVYNKSTIQAAVREGVRYAITGQTQTGYGQDDSIKNVVQQYALGLLNGQRDKIFINYYTPDTLSATASNAGGNIAEISVQGYQYNPLTSRLYNDGSPIMMSVYSSDRVEPLPTAPAR